MNRFGFIVWAALAWGIPTVAVLPACGAGSAETAAPEAREVCPSLDAYLGGIYELVESGGLTSLSAAIGSVHPDLQADLVRTLLDIVGAFAPGTFSSLEELGEAVVTDAELPGTLADVLDFIVEGGPGAPYEPAFGALERMLRACDGPPLLELVKSVVEDTDLIDGLSSALSAIDLASTVDGLEVDGSTGRQALRALVRNLLAAASRDDFDVNALIELLAFLVDTSQPPFDTLVDALTKFLGPGPSLQAVQGLLNCLQVSDPELALIDLLVDIVTSDSLTLLDTLTSSGDGGENEVSANVPDLLVTVLNVLIDDASARRALADVLVAIMSSEAFEGLLSDLATLLRADLLGDLVRALSSLATRGCDDPTVVGGS